MENLFQEKFLKEGRLGGLGEIQGKHIESERKEIIERWSNTGLLDGLDGRVRENIAQLYENTANYILEATASDTAGSFETIAFPLIRRVFAKLLLNDIVTVQALNYTIGKLFFFRPLISKRNASGDHRALQGAYQNEPVYDSNDAKATSWNSVPAVEFEDKTLYDMYYSDKTFDFGNNLFDRSKANYNTRQTGFNPSSTITPGQRYVSGFVTGFSTTNAGKVVGPAGVPMDTEEFLAGLVITSNTLFNSIEATSSIPVGEPIPYRVKTLRYGSQMVDNLGRVEIELDLSTPVSTGGFGQFSGITSATTFTAVWREYQINENDSEMAEVTFDLDEVTVSVGRARKMRAQWTPELSMDVMRYQNIDAEAELTALLSDTVASEIDSEGLRDLTKFAAWPSVFDYNGLKRQSTTYYGTQKDWNQGLIEVINQVDAQIYKSTMDGGANFIVCSPEVTALFRNLEYFHVANAGSPTDTVKYNMGIERVGALNNRYTVYQNVKFPSGLILIGRKGDSPMKSGYVYCPYQPVTLTPVMTDFRTFSNVRGIMTRYGKKMINNKYYGKILVHGLPSFGTTELR